MTRSLSTPRQKISKETMDLKYALDKIERTQQQIVTEYVFQAHAEHSPRQSIHYVTKEKTFGKFLKTESIQSIFVTIMLRKKKLITGEKLENS